MLALIPISSLTSEAACLLLLTGYLDFPFGIANLYFFLIFVDH